ncbi:hypothetical protein BDF14DRAFT_1730188, partial [Spinellus fusiger]
GTVYVWGGMRKGVYLKDMYALDMTEYPNNLQWEPVMSHNDGPSARAGHLSVTQDNTMYIFGGTDSKRLFQDIWSYHFKEKSWLKIPAIGYIPIAREYASGALVNGLLYVFGGKGPDGIEFNDLCAFRTRDHRWYMFQNMGSAPSARHALTLTAVKEKLYVIGGESRLRMEDSSVLYILDSSKIKYPPDPTVRSNALSSAPFSSLDTPLAPMTASVSTSNHLPASYHRRIDPMDPFYQEKVLLVRELQARDFTIQQMKKKEQWWKTEVALARKTRLAQEDKEKDTQSMSLEATDSRMGRLFHQLVSVKSELRRVRASIVQQALPASQKLDQADRMRRMALQEAAYYRSKYTAIKERQGEALARIETERATLLEARLAVALKENQSNSKVLQQLQKRAQFDYNARVSAEERVKEAHERAEESQYAHQMALEKLSDMYSESLRSEAELRASSVRIAELTHRLTEVLSHRLGLEETSDTTITMSRLEAATMKSRNETAALKQGLAESRDDIARLRILLSEREEALGEAKRQLEDSHIQLSMMKDVMSQGGRMTTNGPATSVPLSAGTPLTSTSAARGY